MTDKPIPPQSPGLREALHYFKAIRERLETLYALVPNDPRLREHISDEVDWIHAALAAQSPVLPPSGVTSEMFARAIAKTQGHDPDDLAPRTRMCTADNQQVPWWKVFEEEGDACCALSASVAGEAGELLPERMAQKSPALDPGTVKRSMMDYLAITGIYDARTWHQVDEALDRALASPAPGNADHEALQQRVCK